MKKFAKRILPDYVIKGLVQQTDRFSQKGRYKALLKKGETNEVPEERSHVGALFVALINEFLRHDDGLLKECSLVYGIKMEEMVRSSEYFKNCLWPRVAPQFDVTDAYLKSILNEPRFNVHRDNALSPLEIWRSWPARMRKVFLKYFEDYNIMTICKAFDYDVTFL